MVMIGNNGASIEFAVIELTKMSTGAFIFFCPLAVGKPNGSPLNFLMIEGLNDLFQFDLTFVELDMSSTKTLRSAFGNRETNDSFAWE